MEDTGQVKFALSKDPVSFVSRMNGDCGEVPILDKRILESFDGTPPTHKHQGGRPKRFVAEVLPSSTLAIYSLHGAWNPFHTPYLVAEQDNLGRNNLASLTLDALGTLHLIWILDR